MLKLTPLLGLGGFAMPGVGKQMLERTREWSARGFETLRSEGKLAPVFARHEATPLEHFPVNSYLTDDPEVDAKEWRLTVSGAVERPGEYTLDRVKALPRVEQTTRHVCIEGWSAIGVFGGARLGDFLRHVGAARDARFLEFECADDYYEFLEIPAAVHPQALLCYEMYGQPLTAGHGAPLRLQMPAKLGYKQAKHLTEIRVTRVLGKRRGYWVDQGYPPYGSL